MIRIGLILALGCLFFLLYPQIDIAISKLFFENGFYLKSTLFARFIYRATMIITTLFALATLILFLYESITKKILIKRSILIYLLLTLALGPGLIVNEVFKNHFGRARPSQITLFGGTKQFTPALIPTDQCKHNCSFTSGHAAAAFYFVALIPLIRKKWLVWLLTLSWGWIVGIVRIIQGGHFFSDVYCSMVIDIIIAGIMYNFIFKYIFKGSADENFYRYSSYE